MINTLMIALEFPPIQAAGAFRALRFVRHLPSYGIRPIVVSYNAAQLADGQVHNLNDGLIKQIPPDLSLYALDISAVEPNRSPLTRPSLTGVYRGHFFDCESLFKRIRREHSIDVLWATCPPFNVGPLASAAKRYFSRPMILDMRDAWSQWGSAPFRTWFHYQGILQDERRMLADADAVTCVTPQLLEMQRKVAAVRPERFTWIPNAYEQDILPSGTLELAGNQQRVRVGYVGQFYFNALHEDPAGIIPWYRKLPHRWLHYHATRQRWLYRTPYFFFRAWSALCARDPDLGERIEFHHVGGLPDWLPEMARQHGVEDRCTWHGFKPKQDTQAIMDRCDAFLSTSVKVIDGQDYCLASKTFDYIAARKPVLGFVCQGTQKDFLEKSNIAVIFDPDDVEGCVNGLAKIIRHGVRREIDTSFLASYSSLETNRQLASLIKNLACASSAASANY